MLKLSQRDIKQGYAGIKALARKDVASGNINRAMQRISHCATLAQQFNWIYADKNLEALLSEISDSIIDRTRDSYSLVCNRVLLYDEFCVSFILVIQYIDALVAAGKEIVYVAFESKTGRYSDILDYIRSVPKSTIILLKRSNYVVENQQLYKTILSTRPEQLLLHISGTTMALPALFALPVEIKKYLINLADQTFWLGASIIDYVLEFRQFGVSVSQQRRGIRPDQQLLIPFYPVIDNNPFQGFPAECTQEGKVLIFSGSDIYKVLDEKRMYWHLVKRLLDTFPEVVFLFATKGDGIGMDFLQKFICDNHFEGRFIYTKFRPDINEVLAHTDIYMGTCPASGSLMSQLAARNATPILQYYYPGTPDDETEQAICVNDEFQISFQDEESFMVEAEKLIHDIEYRKKQGERLQKAMIGVEQFNEMVRKTLETNKTQIPLKPFDMNYQLLDDRWFALEKAGYIDSMNYIYGLLGVKNCIMYAPVLFLKKQINKIIAKFSK